jgi:hypothetical protein
MLTYLLACHDELAKLAELAKKNFIPFYRIQMLSYDNTAVTKDHRPSLQLNLGPNQAYSISADSHRVNSSIKLSTSLLMGLKCAMKVTFIMLINFD